MLTCCRRKQIHNKKLCPKLSKPPATPSKPTRIPAIRKLPLPDLLKEKHILQEYAESFPDLGCLGASIYFMTKGDMPVHRVRVAKRDKEKVALDQYEQEEIIKKMEDHPMLFK